MVKSHLPQTYETKKFKALVCGEWNVWNILCQSRVPHGRESLTWLNSSQCLNSKGPSGRYRNTRVSVRAGSP